MRALTTRWAATSSNASWVCARSYSPLIRSVQRICLAYLAITCTDLYRCPTSLPQHPRISRCFWLRSRCGLNEVSPTFVYWPTTMYRPASRVRRMPSGTADRTGTLNDDSVTKADLATAHSSRLKVLGDTVATGQNRHVSTH